MIMLKTHLFTPLFLFITGIGFSQYYAAYNDIQNDFYVFEKGIKKRLEFNTIETFAVGGQGVGYVDNIGRFKIYANGKLIDTRLSDPTDLINTDYYLTVSVGEQLRAFHDGKLNLVTNWAQNYKVGDSIIAYNDQLKNNFVAYYLGKQYILENGTVGDGIQQYWVGDNIVAYMDNADYFKVFYHGEIVELLLNVPIKGLQIAKNTIAYVNTNTNAFEIFYKGESFILEDFAPTSFVVGDDMVAYYTNNNEFKVFYNGEIISVGLFSPKNIKLKDNILSFQQDNLLKVFFKGKVYTLESYIPENYLQDFNSLVYIDPYGKLKLFQEGVTNYITAEPILNYDVQLETITYRSVNQNTNIYYRGTTY